MTKSVNGPFTRADYTIVNVANPLDGSIIPAYNLNPAKRGLIDRTDVNSTDRDLRSFSYSGFEFGAAARIGNATLFGGWTIDRTTLNHCDELENWGNLSAVIYDASAIIPAAEVRLRLGCTRSSSAAAPCCSPSSRCTGRCKATPASCWARRGASGGRWSTPRTGLRRARLVRLWFRP